DKFLHKEKSRLSSYFPTVIVSSRRLPFVNKMYYKFSGFTQRLTGVVSSSAYNPQASEEIPVHLKRGVSDRLLYRTTMALTVGGALYCLVALYIAAQPKNK
ncbi:hypothetical protein cypCar_00005313, partial [Cyprinus carpio]